MLTNFIFVGNSKIPGTVGNFKVICGPFDRDIKEKIITKREEGGRSLKHSEEVKELSLQEYQKNVANCEGTVVYRKKGVFNPLKLLIFLPNSNAHLYADPRDNLDIYFTGENIISRIPSSAPRNTDYYGVHRYYFPNQVILCNISNSADHFFYITGKKNFHCNIVKAGIKQRNTVVTKGNFTDFENIHFVFGSNATNHIEVSNAKYVDGKGGSDVITVNNFATVKNYFGDSICGNCSVLLPMNFSDIDSITYTDNIMNIYNKDREFVSVDGQKSFKTADSLFVTLTKINSTTNMATNLHVMKTVDIASNMDNPNFKITKQTSYGSNHVTIGGDGNYIFYPDKENHTFYWEAHDNMKHLYLFIGRDNNFSVGKANGILDFSHSAKKELLPKIIDEGKVQFYDEDRKLRVTLLPNYKNVVVTFDRYKYYRLQGKKLERDYCSHDLKIDGRFYVDVRELLYLYNCFTFSGDKILFVRQGNNLVLVSAKGLLLVLDYYHVYDYWWDFSIKLDNSIIEPKELKKRADNSSSLRYYHPHKEVLRIYHNQPINKHQIGLVDLEGKSILDFNMKIVSDSLVMLYKNDTFVVVENWNNYEPAREMMFAFNEMIVSNAKCLVSSCDPKDTIKDFQKAKRKADVDIEKYSKKLKEEKTLQRKRRHHHGNRPRHHDHLSRKLLAIDLGNQPERQDTSKGLLQNDEIGYKKATSEPTSWINVFANTIVGGVKGISRFIFSLFKPAIGMAQPSKAMATQGIDTNGTLLLLDVFIRNITGQKYISTADQLIISLPEVKYYASDIINGFEKLLKETAVKSGISVTKLSFDPIKLQSDIVGQLINGKFSEILKTLYLSAKQACPEFKQNKKFLSRLNPRIEEFLDKKGKEFSSIDLKCKEVKQTRKRELYGSANFITDNHTTLSLANTSRSESQLPGKTDDKPRTYLNDSTVDNQLQRSL
ncbi:MAG: hypothetical protein ACEY3K_09710 [Wolbachia sp.]